MNPNRRRKTNARISPEGRAEALLLQSLVLRIGQEAARQNGIEVSPYLELEADPRGASLAALEGVSGETVSLRVTLTVEVNARTGAVIGFTPPPRPGRP